MNYIETTVPAIRFENGDVLMAINREYQEYHVEIDTGEIVIYEADEMEEIYGIAPKTL